MTPEERELIVGLFGRLQQFENQPRDREVEALLAGLIARQPAAPFLLTQTVLVQEQALKGAQERIAELEAKAGSGSAPSGFLSSAPKIGPWGASPASLASRAAAPPQSAAMQGRQPTQGQPPMQAPGGGGSFLRTALTTAAGVAGGALLFEGIRNMMGHTSGPFGGSQQSPASQQALADTSPPAAPEQQTAYEDSAPSDNYDVASDDSGFDGGGSDDFA